MASDLRSNIERDGFAVVPGLFTRDQIAQFRAEVGGFLNQTGSIFHLGKTQPNAAVECTAIERIFHDPRVVETFRSAIGEDEIVFTWHCDVHQDVFSTWHKDTGGPKHTYFTESPFVEDCNVIKMAVYLQDHDDDAGLSVQPGSHLIPDVKNAAGETIHTKAGDVIMFDVRLTHRGRPPTTAERALYAVNIRAKKLLGRLAKNVDPSDFRAFYQARRLLDRLQGRPKKESIFFTFGARNRFTDQFAERNMVRQKTVTGVAGQLPQSIYAGLESQGVEVFEHSR